MLTLYQQLLQFANPACTRCHGRGVVAHVSHEFMGMYGMDRAYQDFYEEDFCQCLQDIPSLELCDMLVEELITVVQPYSLTLFEQMHWGCPLCEVSALRDARSVDGYYINMLEAELEQLKGGEK